jgi:DNA-binding response OmpR family regulator
LHCAGQEGIDLAMGFRLFLANKDVQTTHLFREAVSAIKSELFLYESLEPAKQAVQAERFDVIFADTNLDGLTRWDFSRLVRGSRFNGQAPIVFLTGYDKAEKVPSLGSDNVSLMRKPSDKLILLPFLKALKRKLVAERRKQQRLPFYTEVLCAFGVRRLRAHSINLNARGFLLEGSFSLKPGDEFEARFQLETAEPVFRSRVRVVRIDRARRIAVSFEGLSTIDRQRLRRFLDRHLPPLE